MATTHAVAQLAVYRQDGKEGIKWNRDPGEEASQDFVAMTPLVEDASTKEVEEDTSAGSSAILGFAVGPASGTAGTAVGYYEANENLLITATFRNGSSAVALAVGDINTAYGFVIDATGNTYVDKSNTTQKKVIVLGPAPGSAIGDTNARVICRVCSDMQAKTAAA
jgi:hypothetical protein